MDFRQAFKLMLDGVKVKLPSWGGYWFWDKDKETVIMHTKDGEEINLFDTDRARYTLENIASNEWTIADETNCPELGGQLLFGFDAAIKYLKRGLRLKRNGWNGKEQHIELATKISYETANGHIVNCNHSDIGNNAIAFVGTSGVQIGWLASQADMLAEDWTFAK